MAGPDTCPAWYHLHDMDTDKTTKVRLQCVTNRRRKRGLHTEADRTWKVIIGSKLGRKSLLDPFQSAGLRLLICCVGSQVLSGKDSADR